jgi:hypothetical protein
VLAYDGETARAVESHRLVIDRLPGSPERTFALIGLAKCYALLGKTDEARRTFELAHAQPDLGLWTERGDVDDWVPLNATIDSGMCKTHVAMELEILNKPK